GVGRRQVERSRTYSRGPSHLSRNLAGKLRNLQRRHPPHGARSATARAARHLGAAATPRGRSRTWLRPRAAVIDDAVGDRAALFLDGRGIETTLRVMRRPTNIAQAGEVPFEIRRFSFRKVVVFRVNLRAPQGLGRQARGGFGVAE